MWQLCGYDRVDISLTVPSSAVLKIVKSMCNGTKKNQMHTYEMSYNVMSTLLAELPHKFSYIVAILIYNHFESPNRI
jgi:hypothetical protein